MIDANSFLSAAPTYGTFKSVLGNLEGIGF